MDENHLTILPPLEPAGVNASAVSAEVSPPPLGTLEGVIRPNDSEVNASGDDITMDFAAGSVVYSVEGVRFRIAKSLLQQHSDGLSAMLDMNGAGDEEVIVLHDSLSAFREFRRVMYTPFSSCLAKSSELYSPDELRVLLDLLAIAHKYCAQGIESMALAAAIKATTSAKVQIYTALGDQVVLDILKTAHLVASPELGKAARVALLETMRNNHPPEPSARQVLQLGKDTDDLEIMGAAYYSIMRDGRHCWKDYDYLSDTDRQRLTEGTMRCAEAWQRMETRWCTDGFGCIHTTTCYHKNNVIAASIRVQAQDHVAWFDILGKIEATLKGNGELVPTNAQRNSGCSDAAAAVVERDLTQTKHHVYKFFFPTDGEDIDEESGLGNTGA